VREIVPLVSAAGLPALRKTTADQPYFGLLFGVDEKDVRTQDLAGRRQAGVITVTVRLPEPGQHGPERVTDERFVLGAKSAIEIQRKYVDENDARFAASVLFHETVHLADYQLAQQWAERFTRETRLPMMSEPEHQEKFFTWVANHRALSKDDARTIVDVVKKAHGATEARAYVTTFIVALQAGAGDVALEQLRTYAKTDAVAQEPPAIVQVALRDDLDRALQALDAKGQADFKAAFKAAKAARPDAWISKLTFGSGRRS
jgi:hypothetical protein